MRDEPARESLVCELYSDIHNNRFSSYFFFWLVIIISPRCYSLQVR